MHPVPQSVNHAAEAVAVARAILIGSLGLIEGSRRLASIHLYSGHVRQPIDTDYSFFLGIASETDHLPVGEVRRHWSVEALVKKDVEIAEAEAFFRERAIRAASAIIERHEGKA